MDEAVLVALWLRVLFVVVATALVGDALAEVRR